MPFNLTSYAAQLSMEEAKSFTYPLVLLTAGFVIYSLFIFTFYRFLAHKDVFQLKLQQYKGHFAGIEEFFGVVLYIAEYIVILPLFIFFWFLVMVLMVAALSEAKSPELILLMAMSMVAATRVVAFISNDLANDMAKLLPFVLLGIFVIDIRYFDFNTYIATLMQFPALWETILYYLAFTMILEMLLRLFYGIYCWRSKKE
ncbi:MAG: hypothetical protein V1702_06385 [Candidatus Woesearchaeota archaeon]